MKNEQEFLDTAEKIFACGQLVDDCFDWPDLPAADLIIADSDSPSMLMLKRISLSIQKKFVKTPKTFVRDIPRLTKFDNRTSFYEPLIKLVMEENNAKNAVVIVSAEVFEQLKAQKIFSRFRNLYFCPIPETLHQQITPADGYNLCPMCLREIDCLFVDPEDVDAVFMAAYFYHLNCKNYGYMPQVLLTCLDMSNAHQQMEAKYILQLLNVELCHGQNFSEDKKRSLLIASPARVHHLIDKIAVSEYFSTFVLEQSFSGLWSNKHVDKVMLCRWMFENVNIYLSSHLDYQLMGSSEKFLKLACQVKEMWWQILARHYELRKYVSQNISKYQKMIKEM